MNKYELYSYLCKGTCKAVLAAERAARRAGDKKHTANLFSEETEIPFIGSSLNITCENAEETFLDKEDGEFRILSAADLHLMSDAEKDNKTIGMLMRNIRELKPDLIVLAGDIFTTDHPILDAVQFAAMMEKTGIYWCWVYGNHECREDFSPFKYALMKTTADFPHCLSKTGKKELFGVGNFAIHLTSGRQLVKSLYFFDSGRNIIDSYREKEGCPENIGGYDFIKKDQISWYRAMSGRMNTFYGANASFAYLHIPLCEYQHVFKQEGDIYQPSGECNIEYGGQKESIGCSEYNSGLFDALLTHGTQAVFAGHDHVNDFCAAYKGIKLVYCQNAGYDEYNMGTLFGSPEEDFLQGVTETDIKADGSFNVFHKLNSRFL